MVSEHTQCSTHKQPGYCLLVGLWKGQLDSLLGPMFYSNPSGVPGFWKAGVRKHFFCNKAKLGESYKNRQQQKTTVFCCSKEISFGKEDMTTFRVPQGCSGWRLLGMWVALQRTSVWYNTQLSHRWTVLFYNHPRGPFKKSESKRKKENSNHRCFALILQV